MLTKLRGLYSDLLEMVEGIRVYKRAFDAGLSINARFRVHGRMVYEIAPSRHFDTIHFVPEFQDIGGALVANYGFGDFGRKSSNVCHADNPVVAAIQQVFGKDAVMRPKDTFDGVPVSYYVSA